MAVDGPIKPYTGLFVDDAWIPVPPTVSFWEAQFYAVNASRGMPPEQIIEEMKQAWANLAATAALGVSAPTELGKHTS